MATTLSSRLRSSLMPVTGVFWPLSNLFRMTQLETPEEERPKVGQSVRVGSRTGTIVQKDDSYLPFKVAFNDDQLPVADWVCSVELLDSAAKERKKVDVKGNFSGGKLRPYHNALADWFGVQFTSLPKIGLAVLCYTYTVDMQAAADGWDFAPGGWVSKIFLRDFFLMLLIPCVWDWIHHSDSSPLRERLAAYKFEKATVDAAQFRRDFLTTTSALLIATMHEVILMRWWASGSFKRALFGSEPAGETSVPWGKDNPFFGSEYTPYFILWTVTMLHWRISHFYFVHRMIHPWWDRENGLAQGDLGSVLYYYVHSHHHKSYNPTALSGISMLPIEASAYFSAAFIPMCFRSACHPWIYLYTKLDLGIGAQFGHTGYDAPSTGSYFHQLHHAHFECNFGDSTVPLDWLFGSFSDGTEFENNTEKAKDVEKAKLQVARLEGKKVTKAEAGDPLKMPLLAYENNVPAQAFTMEDVSQHSSEDDCWIILHGIVLDVTHFLKDHPGGSKVLLRQAGKDATSIFESIHSKKGGYQLVGKHAPDSPIGYIEEYTKPETDDSTAAVNLTAYKDAAAQVVLNGILVLSSWGLYVLMMGS
mmetsp:Transcript_124718/g.216169  ORF Transcript_124718/g.216169 Transcript_124718/m.216169 type:complete len:589 (+) Transcript_124718:107-1873(+)